MIPIVFAFHAEQLHDDNVWRRTERVARYMTKKGLQAVFFVYPFRAQVAGRDITDRVRTLAALGHEIGQHTHFYAGTNIDKLEKVDDLSEANIIHCLYRDFETLQRMGFSPQGFTAGAWMVTETVLNTLVELGFTYDCSACFPKPKGMTSSPYRRWLWSPQLYSNTKGCLLSLPSTCRLGEWFKWGRGVQSKNQVPYQLIYLHDYDLLGPHVYLLLWYFLAFTRSRRFMPVHILIKRIEEKEAHD